ncbi:MAG: saccharopine dehydrogenase NADP-binding domain-containing protein [Anaerolineales bacterium]|jgi:saccharopine dehydrogenase-like NADP-dependent oxidoreductase|nr:saccharopine dehydrogenase NADP-binding domain-containing protein [Anaerolineales bacterium]
MKALVIGGCGKIGRAVAWDLVTNYGCEEVGIADANAAGISELKYWLGSKITGFPLNIDDLSSTIKAMRKFDVVVITLPDRRTSYLAIEAAIEAGVDCVDVLEEYHRRPDVEEDEGLPRREMGYEEYGEWLHTRAQEKGVTVLDGMGFAPGLSNVTVGKGLRMLDTADRAVARVGGIPTKETAARHPLKYLITWAFSHVLREYMIKVQIIKNGKIAIVQAMDERESFRFTELGKDEELEAFITPGMPSFIYTRSNLNYFAEKTVRWPGHWQAIQTLKECGMLEVEPVDCFVPRMVLSKVLTPKLTPKAGDLDACVMYNTVEGKKDGKDVTITYHMWDEGEPDGFTSMARVTGFSAAAGAVLLAKGMVQEKGIVAPEDAVYGEAYDFMIAELKKRNIHIVEKVNA